MSLSLVPAEVLDTLIKIYEESQNTEITTTKIMAALSEVNKQTEIDNLDNDPRFDVVIEFEGKRYYQHKPSYQGKPYFEKYPDYRYYVNLDGVNDVVYVRYNKKGEKVGPVKAGLHSQNDYYRVNGINYMVHRMICEVRESRPLKKGEDVDHNNQNTSDNTASELTICSHADNLLNKQTKCRYKVDELPNNAVEMTELKVGKNVWKIGRKDANFEYHYYFAKLDDEDDFDVYMTLNCRGSLKTYLLNYDRDTGKPIKYDSEGKRKGYILHHNSPELANKLYHNFSANNIYKQYK